jgi:integrase/recombinase XerC
MLDCVFTGVETIKSDGLLERFEEHLTGSALAPATVVNYLADLRAFLRWSESTRGTDTLTFADAPFDLGASGIQDYCSYLRETKNHVPATINRRLQAIRKFYDFAIEQGWTLTNPASQVHLLGEVVSERTRHLTSQDISRLLAAVRNGHPRRVDRDWAVIQVLLEAGLKLGELTQVRLADVHLDADPPSLDVCTTPGEPSRTVPLEPKVCEALRVYLSTRQAALGVDRLFVNRDGNLLSTRSVQRLLRHYARAAGLDNLTTQALRYVYAKKAYESCGDLKTVARLLGHRHLATTIRYLQPCSPQEQPHDIEEST